MDPSKAPWPDQSIPYRTRTLSDRTGPDRTGPDRSNRSPGSRLSGPADTARLMVISVSTTLLLTFCFGLMQF